MAENGYFDDLASSEPMKWMEVSVESDLDITPWSYVAFSL